MRPKYNHIIVDTSNQSIRCEHCGASVSWTLPMSLDFFVALLHEAIRMHKDCPKLQDEGEQTPQLGIATRIFGSQPTGM